MSDPQEFPIGLPAPEISLSGTTDTASVRLSMDSGRTRQRRRYSADRLVLNVAWTFTTLECNIFRAWLKWKITDGNDQFNIRLVLGGASKIQLSRFVDGKVTFNWQPQGFWLVSAQLEQIFNVGFCTPNLAGFLTNPLGYVDLSQYFGVPVTTPGVATAWRLITDDCGFDLEYYGSGDGQGIINPDGSLNPGSNDPSGMSGWYSDLLSFYSDYPYAEGIYLQLNCGGLWSSRPCIQGGNGTPPLP